MSREEDLCVISDLCQQVRDRDAEIKRLRDWIQEEGVRSNTCTFNVLRSVCPQCECGRTMKHN